MKKVALSILVLFVFGQSSFGGDDCKGRFGSASPEQKGTIGGTPEQKGTIGEPEQKGTIGAPRFDYTMGVPRVWQGRANISRKIPRALKLLEKRGEPVSLAYDYLKDHIALINLLDDLFLTTDPYEAYELLSERNPAGVPTVLKDVVPSAFRVLMLSLHDLTAFELAQRLIIRLQPARATSGRVAEIKALKNALLSEMEMAALQAGFPEAVKIFIDTVYAVDVVPLLEVLSKDGSVNESARISLVQDAALYDFRDIALIFSHLANSVEQAQPEPEKLFGIVRLLELSQVKQVPSIYSASPAMWLKAYFEKRGEKAWASRVYKELLAE